MIGILTSEIPMQPSGFRSSLMSGPWRREERSRRGAYGEREE